MAKPKWLMKPVEMYKTEFGFSHEGPGVIYDYEKSSGLSDTKISFFVLTKNRHGKDFIIFDSKHMNMQSIRRNVETRQDFSKYFKRDLFRIAFGDNSDLKSINKAIGIIKEL